MHLKIITPQQVFLEQEVYGLQAKGSEGMFMILSHHAPLLAIVERGPIKIFTTANQAQTYTTAGGNLRVSNNKAVLLVETILSTT